MEYENSQFKFNFCQGKKLQMMFGHISEERFTLLKMTVFVHDFEGVLKVCPLCFEQISSIISQPNLRWIR
jgi:glycyl-tRNA synthetase alpha subunit